MMYALMLSSLAGLATGLGGLMGAALGRPGPRAQGFSLAFAAGVMLTVSLGDLPAHAQAAWLQAGASPLLAGVRAASLLAMGMVCAGLLARCLPQAPAAGAKGLSSALTVTAVMMLHNLPEGMLTLFSAYEDRALGASLALAVALHNIPEGLAIAVPVAAATASRGKAVGWAFVSGLAEPVGAVLAFTVLRGLLGPLFLAGMLALIAGVMVWACAAALLPDAFGAARGPAVAGLCAGAAFMTLAAGLA